MSEAVLPRRYVDPASPSIAPLGGWLAAVVLATVALIAVYLVLHIGAGEPDKYAGAFATGDNFRHILADTVGNVAALAALGWLLPRLLKRPLATMLSVDGAIDWRLGVKSAVGMLIFLAVFTLPWLAGGFGKTVSGPSLLWVLGLVVGALVAAVQAAVLVVGMGVFYQVLAGLVRRDWLALLLATLFFAVLATIDVRLELMSAEKFANVGTFVFVTLLVDSLFVLLIIRRTGGLEAATGAVGGMLLFHFSIIFLPNIAHGPGQPLFWLMGGPASDFTPVGAAAELVQMGLFFGLLFCLPWRLKRRGVA